MAIVATFSTKYLKYISPRGVVHFYQFQYISHIKNGTFTGKISFISAKSNSSCNVLRFWQKRVTGESKLVFIEFPLRCETIATWTVFAFIVSDKYTRDKSLRVVTQVKTVTAAITPAPLEFQFWRWALYRERCSLKRYSNFVIDIPVGGLFQESVLRLKPSYWKSAFKFHSARVLTRLIPFCIDVASEYN